MADGEGGSDLEPGGDGVRADGSSNTDQEASDSDQIASDADQVASSVDQKAANDDMAGSSSPSRSRRAKYAETRKAREETTDLRAAASAERAEQTDVRADVGRWDALELGRLRGALKEDGLVLFAQPVVELGTGAIVQNELLVRLAGETGDLLAPGEFMPTAERFGLVSEIDRWVIKQAVMYAAQGHFVELNLSGGTLADPDLGPFVERELEAGGASATATSIVFEVTETALIGNVGLAVRFFDRVRSLGCGVAIDDFGSGYGGFRYLKNFSVDYLKIDREFVSDLLTDPASEKVVRAVVQLADEFQLVTVAEGVESRDVSNRLLSLGVDLAQGFYFARPGPASEVLRAGAGRTGTRS